VIAYGDGQQSRDFTYVDDIARGTLAALKPMALWQPFDGAQDRAQGGGFEVINLGSDEPIVLNDAIRLVEELVGKKATIEYRPRHPADVLATWADISKAERLLGWRPQFTFEEGVAQLVAWYRTNREWAKKVSTLHESCNH
jgi:nucleoside-diphosphate-sugar epimerase